MSSKQTDRLLIGCGISGAKILSRVNGGVGQVRLLKILEVTSHVTPPVADRTMCRLNLLQSDD
jgi:hypothetical protein